MAKRANRLPSMTHERTQIERLKAITPNTTLPRYQGLSDGVIEVALAALDIAAALEGQTKPDFEVLYDLVDGLADLVDSEESSAAPAGKAAAPSEIAPESKAKPELTPSSQGGITAMKTTVIGRPEQVEVQGDTIILKMVYTPQPGATGYSLPKGVPDPQEAQTPVVAYVGRKQFEKVKGQLDDPTDALIIEGAISQVIDGVLTVYASNITTRGLQMAKVAQQKAAAQAQNAQ